MHNRKLYLTYGMVLCLVTLTDLQTRRAGLSASAELLVIETVWSEHAATLNSLGWEILTDTRPSVVQCRPAPYRIVLLSPERSSNQDHALFRTSENSSTGCCFSYVWKIRQLRCYNPLSMSPSPRQLSWQWCVPEFENSVGPCDVDIWPFLFQNWDSVTCAKWRISTEVDVSKTFRTRLILSPEWDRYFLSCNAFQPYRKSRMTSRSM